jgi:hypothetical protein
LKKENMKAINKRQFFAWLRAQPPARKFEYMNGNPRPEDAVGCPLCEFFRHLGISEFGIGGSTYRIGKYSREIGYQPIPGWLEAGLRPWGDNITWKPLTAGNLLRALGDK